MKAKRRRHGSQQAHNLQTSLTVALVGCSASLAGVVVMLGSAMGDRNRSSELPSGSRTRPRLRRPLAFVGLEPTAPAFLWKPLHGIVNVMKCAGVHVVWLTPKLQRPLGSWRELPKVPPRQRCTNLDDHKTPVHDCGCKPQLRPNALLTLHRKRINAGLIA